MHPLNTPAIRWLRRSQRAAQRLFRWLEAVQSGIFMGLIDDESFQNFDTYPFDETKPLNEQRLQGVLAEAERGLEPWERQVVREHLADAKSILVVAAGGARELVGLHGLGYSTTGAEYGRQLCEETRYELARRECSAPIQWCQRFEVPSGDEPYDAAFVARKFLSHVHDRRRRIELLTNIRQTLQPDARLVIAYYIRPRDTLAFRIQAALANLLRRLRGRRDSPVEIGDHLDPESPLYHHHFVWQELCHELREAGYAPIEHQTTWFGWAVARPLARDEQRRTVSSAGHTPADSTAELVDSC